MSRAPAFKRLFNSYGIVLSDQVVENRMSNMGPYRYLTALPQSENGKSIEFGAYYVETDAVQLFGVLPEAIKNLIGDNEHGEHIFNDDWYYTVEHFMQDVRHLHRLLDPRKNIPPRVFMRALSYHADLNAQLNLRGGGFLFKRPFTDCVKLASINPVEIPSVAISSPLLHLWLSDLPVELALQFVADGKNWPLYKDLLYGR